MNAFAWQFWQDEQGQDIVEYALLLAFVVIAFAGLFPTSADKIGTVWSTVNTKLDDSIKP